MTTAHSSFELMVLLRLWRQEFGGCLWQRVEGLGDFHDAADVGAAVDC
jgi:hypothetical protein